MAGIVIGICLMIALVVFYHCWRRRRRQAVYDVFPPPIISPSNVGACDADTQITEAQRTNYAAHLPSATTASDAPSGTVPEAPLIPNRRHLQTESHYDAAQEKMDLDAELVSNAHPAGISARVLSTLGASSARAAGRDPDLVVQLRAMTARIRELEAQVESPQTPWPATPPPGYSGDGRSSVRLSS